jgi:hypothetical protein
MFSDRSRSNRSNLVPFAVAGIAIAVGATILTGVTAISGARKAATYKPCPDVRALVNRASQPEVLADNPHFTAESVTEASSLKWECDTAQFLRDLFDEVTRPARSDLDRGLIWVSYLQRTISHSCYAPHDSDGWAIYHPIALLQMRLMHCSQVARLVVDGFIAAGIPSRVLQMNGHQSAEFFADGRWILAEADILGGGQFLRNSVGEPVGIDEAREDPTVLESVLPYNEVVPNCRGMFSHGGGLYTPWFSSSYLATDPDVLASYVAGWASVFVPVVYPEWTDLETPYVIKKLAKPEDLNHQTYGWNRWAYCARSDPDCVN